MTGILSPWKGIWGCVSIKPMRFNNLAQASDRSFFVGGRGRWVDKTYQKRITLHKLTILEE